MKLFQELTLSDGKGKTRLRRAVIHSPVLELYRQRQLYHSYLDKINEPQTSVYDIRSLGRWRGWTFEYEVMPFKVFNTPKLHDAV